MNKIATIALSTLGGSALFAVSFLGFAKLNNVPLDTLPVVGGLFPKLPVGEDPTHAAPEHAPVEGETKPDETAHATQGAEHPTTTPEAGTHETAQQAEVKHEPSPKPLPEAHAGIFDLLDVDGLYTQDELRALGESLRAKNREVEQRIAELNRREELLSDRLTALDERRSTMDAFAKQLDARERELSAREAEAPGSMGADGSAQAESKPADLAQFFADGEVETIAKRLVGFTPEEGAQILARLEPARAKELLEALPTASWRPFAEAYALAAPKKP